MTTQVITSKNQGGTALRAPEIVQSSVVNTAAEKMTVRLKQGSQDSVHLYQAKKTSVATTENPQR